MQAPLSSTASGTKVFIGSPHAVLPCFSAEVQSEGSGLQFGSNGSSSPSSLKRCISEGAGLAHDAGNLFHALGLYCELLSSPGVLRAEHSHYAEALQMISGRSRALIDRLLNPVTTGRPATLPRKLHDQVVLPEVIEQCRGLLDTIARRALEVVYEAGTALPITISREALERILVNLTKNAAEASRSTLGTIMLRVSCLRSPTEDSTDRIVLRVEDKGRGMSSAAIAVLLGEGQEQIGPHGLGFRVVRELVGASGGSLHLSSRVGAGAHGTTVEISWAVATLPQKRSVDAPSQASFVAMKQEPLPMLIARGGIVARRVQC